MFEQNKLFEWGDFMFFWGVLFKIYVNNISILIGNFKFYVII